MKVVITEQQYQTILCEGIKDKIFSIIERSKELAKRTLKDSILQTGGSFRFLLSYGTGIGALVEPVNKFLSGEYPTLNEGQIAMLSIMAISVVFFANKDYKKEINKIKQEGLTKELTTAVSFTEKMKKKIIGVLKVMGISVHTIMDIVAFTFLLPIIGLLVSVTTTYGVRSQEFMGAIQSVVSAIGANIAGIFVKDLLLKIAKIIEGSPTKTEDPDETSEVTV